MTQKKNEADDNAAAKEMEGVPEHLREGGDEPSANAERISMLEEQLAAAKQDVLYAQADTQNVRRRMEKEATDARAYAATNFARDILSVSDNLTRALEAIPAELRENEKMKPLVTGLEATGRELESVFAKSRGRRYQNRYHREIHSKPTPVGSPHQKARQFAANRQNRCGYFHCRPP